jgi:hypothetical protein
LKVFDIKASLSFKKVSYDSVPFPRDPGAIKSVIYPTESIQRRQRETERESERRGSDKKVKRGERETEKERQ